MKKMISSIITSILFSVSLLIFSLNVFAYTDVPAAWAREASINSLFHEIAYSSFVGEYNREMTREEFAMMAVNVYRTASGKELKKPESYTFNDISLSPYKDEIQIAKDLGIVKGTNTEQTMFSPTNLVTRQEICVMIFRLLQIIDPDHNYTDIAQNSFIDRSSIAAWALKEVDFAYNEGIMQGTSSSSLQISPLNDTTREQGMTLVYRMMKNWGYITPVSERLLNDINLYQNALNITDADYLEDYLRDSLMNRKRDIRIVLSGSLLKSDIESRIERIVYEFDKIGQYYAPKVASYAIDLYSPIYVITVKYHDPVNAFPESLVVSAANWQEFDNWLLLQVRSGISKANYDLDDASMRNSVTLMSRISTLLYANPELNYVRKYNLSYNGGIPERYEIIFEFEYSEEETQAYIEQVKNFASDYLRANTAPGMSAMEKELKIHDFIVSSTEYYTGTEDRRDIFYESGVFFSNRAVCQGYASAIKLLLNMSGIYATGAYGTGNSQPHAWNLVRLYGDYYHLDATWNDPVPDDPGKVRYDYFNVTKEEILKTHTFDPSSTFPDALGIKYNYYTYIGASFNSTQEVVGYIKSKIQNDEKEFTFKISDYSAAVYDISKLIRQAYSELGINTYSYTYSINSSIGVFDIKLN
jgi:hypothetical protein